MKAIIILFTILSFNLFAAKSLSVKNKIDSVKVFKDRAFITRTSNINIRKGSFTLSFYPVTSLLDKDSIKFKSGDNNLKVLAVRSENIHLKQTRDKGLQKLRKKQSVTLDEIKTIRNKVQTLIKEHQGIRDLSKHYQESFSLVLHQGKWNKGQIDRFVRFIEKRSNKMQGKWTQLFKKYISLSERNTFIQNKIAELTRPSELKQLKILVDVQANKKSNYNLTLEYLVNNAGWRPQYDLRVIEKSKKAKMEQHALVWQDTGEDWQNVKLTLSNKRSEIRPTPPSLSSYTLNYKKVEKVKTIVKNTRDDASSLNKSGQEDGDEQVDFNIKTRQTIMGGMPELKTPIASKTTSYTQRNELIAPKFKQVFKKLIVKNPFNWKLPAAKVSVFIDNSYSHEFNLVNDIYKNESFAINAGIDYNITVYRHHKDENGKAGLITSSINRKRIIKTHIYNYDRRSKNIRVYEQVPVSELSKVKVTHSSSLNNFKLDKERPSWLYWDLKIPSRKSQVVELSVSVEAPADFKFNW